MAKAKFRGKFSEIKTIGDIMIAAYLAKQTLFFTNSNAFTVLYGTNLQTDLNTADAMPDKSIRQANNDIIREELLILNAEICELYDTLLGYIATIRTQKKTVLL